jgi:hypothetical protein
MSTYLTRKQTPEERELEGKRARLAALEAELVQRELELATLRAELATFELRYLRTVGVLYAELDEIEAQIAEAQACLNPTDPSAQEHAEQARAQAQESAQAAGVAVHKPDEQQPFTALEHLGNRIFCARSLEKVLSPSRWESRSIRSLRGNG